MLYVFLVDTGTMMTFDMNLALEKWVGYMYFFFFTTNQEMGFQIMYILVYAVS